MKKVGLFIPCYLNDYYPDAAMATLKVLKAHGFDVVYPKGQTCCGQPFINNGLFNDAKPLAERMVTLFEDFDYIVAPSSSCTGTVKQRYDLLPDFYNPLKEKIFELCEFLHDVVRLEHLRFKKAVHERVGLHNSCHALRELHLAAPSELNIPHYSKIKAVLSYVPGLEIVEPSRDECCGFGGTFSIQEPEVSVRMGQDRIEDHLANGVKTMAGVDMSCLMHMEAIAKKEKIDLRFVHVAQLMEKSLEA